MLSSIPIDDDQQALLVYSLQKAAYEVEASLIGTRDIPLLTETLEELKSSEETFLGYFNGEVLEGFISYKISGDTLDIHRLAVHPFYFRKGIGDKLVSSLESIRDIKKIIVSTGRDNHPAIRLYLKKGFRKLRNKIVGKGTAITLFEKTI